MDLDHATLTAVSTEIWNLLIRITSELNALIVDAPSSVSVNDA